MPFLNTCRRKSFQNKQSNSLEKCRSQRYD